MVVEAAVVSCAVAVALSILYKGIARFHLNALDPAAVSLGRVWVVGIMLVGSAPKQLVIVDEYRCADAQPNASGSTYIHVPRDLCCKRCCCAYKLIHQLRCSLYVFGGGLK